MKKVLMGIVWLFWSVSVLALPAPRDIDAAVKAGDLAGAESMLREVIAAKPTSARAHYELGQVLARAGKLPAARQALTEAERLDPALKFARDPVQFRNLQNAVELAGGVKTAAPKAGSHVADRVEAPAGIGWPLGLLIGGGVLAAIWFFLRRASTASPAASYPPANFAASGASGGAAGFGAAGAGTPGAAATGLGNFPAYGPNGAPAPAGRGIGGALLGGAAGLAAGYGLAKLLESGNAEAHTAAAPANGLTSQPATEAPDYGAFDAGSGDDWDNNDLGDVDGTTDDSW